LLGFVELLSIVVFLHTFRSFDWHEFAACAQRLDNMVPLLASHISILAV
jgi:hypothetical protein